MKKILSIVLCIIILNTLFMPAISFAAEDKGLENAIKIAKSEFKIPESYTFNFDVNSQNSKKVWSLYWTSKSSNGESISVRVDETGRILGYDNNKSYYNGKKKLPKISNAEAKNKAISFMKKMNPKNYNELKLMDNVQSSLLDYAYSFVFVRIIKNIPYYADSLNIIINKDSGEVQNYNSNWSADIVFPDAGKAISKTDAQKAFRDKLGLELIYKYTYQNEKLRIYPVYVPKFNNDSYAIDALSGEKIQTGYAFSMYDRAGGMGGAMNAMKSESGANVALTPEETKAIEDMSKLLSQDEAEKQVRNMKYFNLNDEFKLESAYLSRSWPLRTDFQWQLNFIKKLSGKTTETQNIYVSINAKTGDLLSFYKNSPMYGDKDVAKYDEAAAKAATEEFLKEIQPEKFKQTELDVNVNNNIKYSPESASPRQYNFSYIRKVNGARFPDNNFNVNFDAVSGEITNYNLSWFNVDFPSIAKAVSIDKAYGNMFGMLGLELQYKQKYVDEANLKMIALPQNKSIEVVPVYSLKNNKPLILDAFNGEILDYNGALYKESLPVHYSDIAGHYAEKQIMLLSEYGISLEGSKFRPNENITQKDYLILLSKTLGNYYGPVLTASSSDSDINQLYDTMIREGIIKANEKAPKSIVKREDGVKLIIRAMKYDKVADIKGIFKSGIKDLNKASSELTGYIIIAEGLHIIKADKNYFKPKDGLTRAEAMIMLYNYLQI